MSMVSICIPAYQQAGALERCLRSVFSQTFMDIEVVVTDDTQDESVRRVAEKYAGTGKLLYIHNDILKGAPGNWNEAMRNASGKYLVLMHQDDWFYTHESLELLVQSIVENAADLAFAQSYGINPEMVIISKNNPDRTKIRAMGKDIRSLYYANWIGAPSAVLFKNTGLTFDARLKWLVDVDFYIRYLQAGRLCYNDSAIVGIGISASQITNSCVGNPGVEIGENILVYKKLKSSWKHLYLDFQHFYRLFCRFQPRVRDLREYSPPLLVQLACFVAESAVPTKSALRKLFRRLKSPKRKQLD